jgi:CBS domain-containing protein
VRVGEIMTRDVVTAASETTVSELARLLWINNVSGLPVVDGERRVVGIVSESDLLVRNAHLQVPTYVRVLDALIPLSNTRRFDEDLRKALGSTAADIMTSPVVTIDPDAELVEAATLMMDRHINRLPVVEDDRLVGIVSRADFVRLMVQQTPT